MFGELVVRTEKDSEAKEAGKSFAIVSILTGLLLVVCSIGSDLLLSAYISVGVFLFYCLFCVMIDPASIFKYFILYFAVVANIVGCFVVETNDMYLSEMRMNSGFNGSLPLLILARWLFVAIIVGWDQVSQRKEKRNKLSDSHKRQIGFIFNLSCLCLLCALVAILSQMVSHAPSFLLGMDRFQYANEIQIPTLLRRIIIWMPYLIYIPVFATRLKSTRVLGATCVALWVIYLIWTGEKFGGFMSLVVAFLLANYDAFQMKTRVSSGKIFIGAVVIMAILVCAAVGIAGIQQGLTNHSSYLNNRLAQQGQLWWANYKATDHETHFEQLQKELEGLNADSRTSENQGSQYAIYGVMYRTVPTSVVDAKLATGSRYTEAGYAAVYYVAGKGGVIAYSLIMAVLFAACLGLLVHGMRSCNIVLIIVSARFFILLQTAMSMGEYGDFIDFASIGSYCYLILYGLNRLIASDLACKPKLRFRPVGQLEKTGSRIRMVL